MEPIDSVRSDAGPATGTLSLGASIVLYKTRVAEILPLIRQLLDQRTSLVYLIDNSPKGFDAFEGWTPPDRVMTISTRQNLGYGRANNIAIRDSVRRHKYHLVCNPDVSMGDDTLKTLFEVLERRADVGLCTPRIVNVDGELQYLCKLAPSPVDSIVRLIAPESWFSRQRAVYEMRGDEKAYAGEMSPEFVSGCFMFFRSEVLGRVDGFDERFFLYYEDVDLSRKALQVAKNIYFPGTTIVHVHARASRKSLRLLLAMSRSACQYFNKWGWFEQPWFR
jgi:GT2 family glycosyltransferase